ncbi:hypothetical protein DITRI_Ditri20bG0078000 [Diplodiscus trichospermus]
MALMGCRRRAIWDIDLVVLGVVFLGLVQDSRQLRTGHPMRGVVDKVNEDGGPYSGLVMAYPSEALALQVSGFFLPNSDIPWIELAALSLSHCIHVVIVPFLLPFLFFLTNAALTVQALLNVFDIRGIVHYGTAGSTNDLLSFGDVSVMNYVAFTGSWKWKI